MILAQSSSPSTNATLPKQKSDSASTDSKQYTSSSFIDEFFKLKFEEDSLRNELFKSKSSSPLTPPTPPLKPDQSSSKLQVSDENHRLNTEAETKSANKMAYKLEQLLKCPGCGAQLQDDNMDRAGYINASELRRGLATLLSSVSTVSESPRHPPHCERCKTLVDFTAASNISVPQEAYEHLMKELSRRRARVLMVVDLTELPFSIHRDLPAIIGDRHHFYIAANKADLLVPDRNGFRARWRQAVVAAAESRGLPRELVRDVFLVSSRTDFGIEQMISALLRAERSRSLYLIGCANAGKSSLFNRLALSDLCDERARDRTPAATVSAWPGTTLNLLSFPLLRADTPLYRREKRLRLLKQASNALQKQREQTLAMELEEMPKLRGGHRSIVREQLTGSVGTSAPGARFARDNVHQGFTGEMVAYAFDRKPELATKNAAADASLHENASSERSLEERFLRWRPLDRDAFENSRWCNDTPGLESPEQSARFLDVAEVKQNT